MLDLFEESAGSAKAEALFREWVAAPSDLSDLDRRQTARSAYQAFVAEDEWAPPRLVRDHMERWRFAEAETAMADARKVIARRDELVGVGRPARSRARRGSCSPATSRR